MTKFDAEKLFLPLTLRSMSFLRWELCSVQSPIFSLVVLMPEECCEPPGHGGWTVASPGSAFRMQSEQPEKLVYLLQSFKYGIRIEIHHRPIRIRTDPYWIYSIDIYGSVSKWLGQLFIFSTGLKTTCSRLLTTCIHLPQSFKYGSRIELHHRPIRIRIEITP